MTSALSRGLSVGVAAAIVLWQAVSCCCCLGGAVTPSMTPYPVAKDLAQQMRERLGIRSGNKPVSFFLEFLFNFQIILHQTVMN